MWTATAIWSHSIYETHKLRHVPMWTVTAIWSHYTSPTDWDTHQPTWAVTAVVRPTGHEYMWAATFTNCIPGQKMQEAHVVTWYM